MPRKIVLEMRSVPDSGAPAGKWQETRNPDIVALLYREGWSSLYGVYDDGSAAEFRIRP